MNDNVFHEIQKDTCTKAYQRRHIYTDNPVAVNGMKYNVISVAPFSDLDYQPESVGDKLKYLINGGKS